MSISDSSTSLRAHVDAALDPIYEQMFAALDLLLAHRTRRRPDTVRILELRGMLDSRLAELDRPVRPEPPRTDRGDVSARDARRWPQ